MTEAALTKFVAGNALPLVIDFNQETAQKIFSGEIKSHLLMFVSAKADEYAAQVRINIFSYLHPIKTPAFPLKYQTALL